MLTAEQKSICIDFIRHLPSSIRITAETGEMERTQHGFLCNAAINLPSLIDMMDRSEMRANLVNISRVVLQHGEGESYDADPAYSVMTAYGKQMVALLREPAYRVVLDLLGCTSSDTLYSQLMTLVDDTIQPIPVCLLDPKHASDTFDLAMKERLFEPSKNARVFAAMDITIMGLTASQGTKKEWALKAARDQFAQAKDEAGHRDAIRAFRQQVVVHNGGFLGPHFFKPTSARIFEREMSLEAKATIK
jgi:hypothetical protein